MFKVMWEGDRIQLKEMRDEAREIQSKFGGPNPLGNLA